MTLTFVPILHISQVNQVLDFREQVERSTFMLRLGDIFKFTNFVPLVLELTIEPTDKTYNNLEYKIKRMNDLPLNERM